MAAVSQIALQDLRAVVGDEHAREAGPEDAIDGVQPRFVAAPGTVEEASELMRLAGKAGLAMSPRGSGTKLGWGNPPSRLDLIVDMRRMNRLLEHASGLE